MLALRTGVCVPFGNPVLNLDTPFDRSYCQIWTFYIILAKQCFALLCVRNAFSTVKYYFFYIDIARSFKADLKAVLPSKKVMKKEQNTVKSKVTS